VATIPIVALTTTGAIEINNDKVSNPAAILANNEAAIPIVASKGKEALVEATEVVDAVDLIEEVVLKVTKVYKHYVIQLNHIKT